MGGNVIRGSDTDACPPSTFYSATLHIVASVRAPCPTCSQPPCLVRMLTSRSCFTYTWTDTRKDVSKFRALNIVPTDTLGGISSKRTSCLLHGKLYSSEDIIHVCCSDISLHHSRCACEFLMNEHAFGRLKENSPSTRGGDLRANGDPYHCDKVNLQSTFNLRNSSSQDMHSEYEASVHRPGRGGHITTCT
jgi:hypothetical protein